MDANELRDAAEQGFTETLPFGAYGHDAPPPDVTPQILTRTVSAHVDSMAEQEAAHEAGAAMAHEAEDIGLTKFTEMDAQARTKDYIGKNGQRVEGPPVVRLSILGWK